MRKYLLMLALCCLAACHSEGTTLDNNDEKEIPLTPGGSEESVKKPKGIWIDAHANLSTLATKANITRYIEMIKDAGFDRIYLDVKPGIGYALYKSDILKPLTKWGNEQPVRDYDDYLGFWLQEAERLDLDVIATISTLGFGATKERQGVVYDDHKWDGKTQFALPSNNNPNALIDIRDQTDVDAAMLNPCLPEVQEFVVSIVQEIITKYPKLKGLCLDYCRWFSGNHGFGDATIRGLETYSGKTVTNKNDIITATGGIGPMYKYWIEYRSAAVTNLITNIRAKVKSIHPEMELQLWASAQWSSRLSVGQNWASKTYIPTPDSRYTSTYNTTGFANQLEVFVLGAYAEAVWIKDNPGSEWSVENFVDTYDNFIKGDCKVYGSIQNYQYDAKGLSDAIYLCMKRTDGLMIFELSHVIRTGAWNNLKEAIKRVEK